MRKLSILAIFFCMFSDMIQAQQVKVLDKSDLQPIGQVNISNATKTHIVITNDLGMADLSGFAASDSLYFTHVRFQSFKTGKSFFEKKNNRIYMTENIIRLDEFVFTANRVEEKKSYLPYKIETISTKDVTFNNPQSSASMLEQSGEVFVQQSQLGGGSPVLRGFEANKVLLVVD